MKKLLLIFFLLSCGSASAALNRWVDAQGNVHYSDTKPPESVESKTLRSTSNSEYTNTNETEENPSNESSGYSLQSIAERQAARKKVKLEKLAIDAKNAKEQANAERLKNYCKTAKENLKALKDGIRLTTIDDKGERSFISDEQRQNNIIKIQKDISKQCN